MKSLQEYIVENIVDIFESSFKDNDYPKHEYRYVIGILNMIKTIKNDLNTSLILFSNSTGIDPEKDSYIELTQNDFDISKLDELFDDDIDIAEYVNKNLKTVNKFNTWFFNLLNKEGQQKVNNNLSTKSLFGRIFKSPFSGKGASAGQSACEEDEVLVSYLFNQYRDSIYKDNITKENVKNTLNKYLDNNIKLWLNNKNKDKNWLINEYHLQSSLLTVKCLLNEFNNQFGDNLSYKSYTAFQSNGKTLINMYIPSKNNVKLNLLFCSRENIDKLILGDGKSSDLFIKKDLWNKADIFLINIIKWDNWWNDNYQQYAQKIDKEIKNISNLLETEINAHKINQIVNELINERIIIPISLKKVERGMNPIIFKEQDLTTNDKKTEVIFTKDDNIQLIPPSENLTDNSLNCSWYLQVIKNNDKYSIQFRLQSDPTPEQINNGHLGNLSIEAKLNKSRMGKGITALQIKYNKKSEEFYYNYDNTENIGNILKNDNNKKLQTILLKYFNLSYEPNDKDKSINNNRFKLSNRTATIGLLGIYDYLTKNVITNNLQSNVQNNLIEVFNTLWTICTVSTSKYQSQWWIIMGSK